MSEAYYEVIELVNGAIALKRAGENVEDSLVTISFSEDVKTSLRGNHLAVAKAMLNTGIQIAGGIIEQSDKSLHSEDTAIEDSEVPKVIH